MFLTGLKSFPSPRTFQLRPIRTDKKLLMKFQKKIARNGSFLIFSNRNEFVKGEITVGVRREAKGLGLWVVRGGLKTKHSEGEIRG